MRASVWGARNEQQIALSTHVLRLNGFASPGTVRRFIHEIEESAASEQRKVARKTKRQLRYVI